MKNLLLLLISLSVILISCGDDNEVSPTSPVIENTGTMYPLAVGNEWVYDVVVECNSGNSSYELKNVILEDMTTTYLDEEVAVYIEKRYRDGEPFYDPLTLEHYFIYQSNFYGGFSPTLTDARKAFPYTISWEEAENMNTIEIGGDTLLVSTSTQKILGKQMKCIAFKNEKSYETSYYVPGIGLVKISTDSDAPGHITTWTLKSYTLN